MRVIYFDTETTGLKFTDDQIIELAMLTVVDGKVVFGELTFYDGSGYYLFEPDDFDEKAGSYFTEYS